MSVRVVLSADGAVDAAELFLPGWESLDGEEMARREVGYQGRRVALGELATASGAADGTVVLEGDWSRAEGVGSGLAGGRVLVDGDVGDRAGTGLAGGTLVIRGSAGDGLGGALPGRKRGMTGGEIVLHGSAGAGLGRAMRRGLIAVGGDVGRGAAYSMLAGTIVCLGGVGADAGILNKRGSLVAAGSISVPPTYRYACTFQPAFLAVVLRRLQATHGLPIDDRMVAGAWQRWSGDLAELGRGEILQWEKT